MTTTGADVAGGFRSGSHAAFRAAFDAHAPEVYAFLARRCGSAVVAEDLLSVVFLEAWRCRDRAVSVDGSLRPWLLGIATNVLRTARRAVRRHADALARYHAATLVAAPDCADDAVREADRARDGAAVRGALARLPRRERDVADLCLVESMSAAEASVVLGVPVATVKSRLARARKRLRHDLGAVTP